MTNAELDELALQIRAGESDDWRSLLEETYQRLTRLLRRDFRPITQDQIDDCLQSTSVKVLERFDQWDPQKGTFVTWSYRIAHNTFIDMTRQDTRKSLRQRALEFDTYDDWRVLAELSRIEDSQLIRQAFGRLIQDGDNQAERVLAAVRDLVREPSGHTVSMADIARRADLTESTARRAMSRVRVILSSLQRDK